MGSFVTRDFGRVFGTNEAFACPTCATMADIADGAARGRLASAPAP